MKQALAGALEPGSLDAALWGGHWAHASALWSGGIARLRGGVERGDAALARSGWPLLTGYFEWARTRFPRHPHFVSSQARPAARPCTSRRARATLAPARTPLAPQSALGASLDPHSGPDRCGSHTEDHHCRERHTAHRTALAPHLTAPPPSSKNL